MCLYFFARISMGIIVQGCTHTPIHSIWRCSNTSYTSKLDVGCSQQGFCRLNHDIAMSFGSTLPQFSKNKFLCPYLHGYHSLMLDPYAHPHHMRVLKHFIHTWYGCGMQSTGVPSLCHDITMLFVSTLPQFSKISLLARTYRITV